MRDSTAGVSNFAQEELQELLELAKRKPSVVQSQSDIFHPNVGLQELCRGNGIVFQVLLRPLSKVTELVLCYSEGQT